MCDARPAPARRRRPECVNVDGFRIDAEATMLPTSPMFIAISRYSGVDPATRSLSSCAPLPSPPDRGVRIAERQRAGLAHHVVQSLMASAPEEHLQVGRGWRFASLADEGAKICRVDCPEEMVLASRCASPRAAPTAGVGMRHANVTDDRRDMFSAAGSAGPDCHVCCAINPGGQIRS